MLDNDGNPKVDEVGKLSRTANEEGNTMATNEKDKVREKSTKRRNTNTRLFEEIHNDKPRAPT